MTLTLYKKDTSAPCRAVFMTIAALDLKDIKYVDINLQKKEQFSEEFLKLNPQHTVPTLVDGDFVISDSHAICAYLVDKYGKNDALYPKDPQKRALVDLRLHFDSGILFPSLKNSLVPVLYQGEKTFRPENLESIKSGYEFIEKFFTGPWLAGDQVTLADISCNSSISSLNEILPIDAKLYPKLSAWFNRCTTQDFYIKGNAVQIETYRQLLKNLLS